MPIPQVQLIYGILAAFSSLLFLIFSRETPPTPPCPAGMEVRALMLDGLKNAVKNRMFWYYLAVSFIGMGLFNGMTTWVEAIIRPRGFTPTDAGTLGAVMLIGGTIGAVVLPPFSDKSHKRKRFLLLGVLAAIPGLIGVTFAQSLWLLDVSAFVMGFFITSISPIGMQYAAEITQPTPEGTSNGLIQLFGQASVVFVYIMEATKAPDGSFTPALLIMVGLLLVSAVLITRLKDPEYLKKAEQHE